jgi:hypothetical protein
VDLDAARVTRRNGATGTRRASAADRNDRRAENGNGRMARMMRPPSGPVPTRRPSRDGGVPRPPQSGRLSRRGRSRACGKTVGSPVPRCKAHWHGSRSATTEKWRGFRLFRLRVASAPSRRRRTDVRRRLVDTVSSCRFSPCLSVSTAKALASANHPAQPDPLMRAIPPPVA